MTSKQDFLNAILADPTNDDLRLVYADWLADNDFPLREEFVRTQIRLHEWKDEEHCPECGLHWHFRVGIEGLSTCDNDHKWTTEEFRRLKKREKELLEEPLTLRDQEEPEQWKRRVSAGFDWHWTRGFISYIRCSGNDWLLNADDILSLHPIEDLELTSTPSPDYVWNRKWKHREPVVGDCITELIFDEWKGIRISITNQQAELSLS